MFVCANCFSDNELIAYINAQSTQVGLCDFCSTKNVRIVDARELSFFYSRFLKAYTPHEGRYSKSLFELIDKDWIIFREGCDYKFKLLAEIFKGFDDFEGILSKQYIDPSTDAGNSAIEDWNQFSNDFKTKNRYFVSSKIDLNLLKQIITHTCSFSYIVGKIFYRARISEDRNGLPIKEMGKPPAEKSSAGRANPKGIPYLYLSNDEKTTLFETRSYVYDYVTIGEFKLIESIKVARLHKIDKIGPFYLGEDGVGEFLSLKPYLIALEKELSKPVRRGDNELDYLPSQYLCEFIKSIGFDGVEYRSSLYEGGFNIALFNDDKVKCIKVKTIQVRIRDIEQEEV